MSEKPENSPWLCHVCDYKSRGEGSTACSVCFKTTCSTHLKLSTVFNAETGLYEIQPICVLCSFAEMSR